MIMVYKLIKKKKIQKNINFNIFSPFFEKKKQK